MKKYVLFFVLFSVQYIHSQGFEKKYCYIEVNFNLTNAQLFTQKITCITQESNFYESINVQANPIDSVFNFTHYFKIGKKRKLKKFNSVHIMLQFYDKNDSLLETINGEILKSDWECK